MENENVRAAEAQPPVMEEHTFSGALFGFRRKDVLEYVRTLSENNEVYIRSLDDSIAALRRELEASRTDAQTLEQRIGELNAELETGAARDAEKQQEMERAAQEFRACREKLFQREQKYVQLQTECRELRRQNAEITSQMEAARELLRRNQEQLAAAAEREQQLAQQHERELAEAARETERRLAEAEQKKNDQLAEAAQQAELQCTALAEAAASREAQLQDEHRQQVQQITEANRQEMQSLETDARGILSRLGARADMEQERLARGVEQVDAELEELRVGMEQVQQQIWAAHAMIRQTTLDMNDLIRRAQNDICYTRPQADPIIQPVPPQPVSEQPVVEEDAGKAFDAVAAEPVPAEKPVSPEAKPAAPAEKPAESPEVKEASGQQSVPRAAQPRSSYTHPHTGRPQPTHTTVRTSRETVADYLLDALGRLWDKR
ncbi:MAG: hypothetical protein IJ412_11430 [Oscillospiraceae bacterium]|nr:hypothetical protein [Oscillospiraceae bacterium]